MGNPVRVAIIGVGFLFSGWHIGYASVLVWIVYLVAVLTTLTVLHRMVHVMRKLRAPA